MPDEIVAAVRRGRYSTSKRRGTLHSAMPATAGLEGRLAAQHHQRLADVEAALEAPDASYAPC